MIEFIEKNILEINNDLNNGIYSSYDLVLSLLNRIKLIDQGNPRYNSVLEINPDALEVAKSMDEERGEGKTRSLMHGIPIILKDNINTTGNTHTTAGSISLANNMANKDANITKLLRNDGAIILGKANLTEFANFMSYEMRNGFSSHGGEVLCPWNLNYDPSGSSAGSAVSVTLNLTPVSIGTETGGSIMSPAMQNGVVGMKPTIGLVSRAGIIPISSTLDTAGPIGKNVTDVAVLLSSIRGNDKNDPITLSKENHKVDYTKYLNIDGIKRKRIGIDRTNYKKLSKENQNAFKEVLYNLEENGAFLIEDLGIKQPKLIFNIMKYEFKSCINEYLSNTNENVPVKSLHDIVEFNKKNCVKGLKYGQKLLEDCLETSGTMKEKAYRSALKERSKKTKEIKDIFSKHKLDAIYFASYTSLGPECGFPTMTIPIGYNNENIPIGVYFMSDMFREDKLISILYGLEQKTNKRRNPIEK